MTLLKPILFAVCISGIFASSVHADADWDAHVIRVAGKVPVHYIEDYAKGRYGRGWDFDGGDIKSPDYLVAARGQKLTNGYLEFVTTPGTTLGWGSKDQSGSGQELIGHDWKQEQQPWVVRIRLSQALEESRWFVKGRYFVHGREKALERKFIVKGKKEQTIVVRMGSASKTLVSLEIGTRTGNNKVRLDWVRLERVSATRYFRKRINIADKPLKAALALVSNAHYKLYINGELVSERGGRSPFERQVNIIRNLSGYFRQGANVIAVEAEVYSGNGKPGKRKDYFFLQGQVLTESGKSLLIKTDSSWRGVYTVKPGWNTVGFDASKWKRVRDKGGLVRNKRGLLSRAGNVDFMAPPYMGRIEVRQDNRPFPFFAVGEPEPLEFALRVIGAGGDGLDIIRYSVTKVGASDFSQSGEITLNKGKAHGGYLRARIRLEKLGEGAYNLKLDYQNKGVAVDTRVYEFIVAGKIAQNEVPGANYEQGMNLVLRDTIDPVSLRKKGQFEESDPATSGKKTLKAGRKVMGLLPWMSSRVEKISGGDFVETAAHKGAWLSFTYQVKNPYLPHLAVIDYPTGRKRNMIFVVAEGGGQQQLTNSFPRAIGGAYTDEAVDSGVGISQFRMIFWPNDVRGTVTLVNAARSREERAAIGRVRIYEIADGLPAMEKVGLPRETFVGPYSERVDRTIPRIFYSGPMGVEFPFGLVDGYFNGYYAAWYNTISNLIRYLRFTGQNTFFAGIYMYHAGWFPSERFQGKHSTGTDYHGAGWRGGVIELMARMFEANDLNLVLGVQFFGSPALLRSDTVSDDEVRDGKPSLRIITKGGVQARGYSTFNFLIPEVRDEIIGLAKEIADRYGDLPGVKGITWMRSPRFAPASNERGGGVSVGYGDQTIAAFKNEVNDIPVPDFKGEKRFGERYQWLMKHAREEWLNWRAEKVFQLDSEIAQTVKSRRSDWKVWRLADPASPKSTLKDWRTGKITYRDIYRHEGLDPLKYKSSDEVNLVPVLEWTGDRLQLDKLGKSAESELVGQFNWSGSHKKYFSESGLFLRIGFMLERSLHAGKDWVWSRMRVVGNSAPANEKFSQEARRLLKGFDPGVVIIGWNDGGHMMGHEQETREIVRSLGK